MEASESVTMLMEQATPATVIIEPAIAASIPRAPSAPALSSGCQPFEQQSVVISRPLPG